MPLDPDQLSRLRILLHRARDVGRRLGTDLAALDLQGVLFYTWSLSEGGQAAGVWSKGSALPWPGEDILSIDHEARQREAQCQVIRDLCAALDLDISLVQKEQLDQAELPVLLMLR